CGEEPFGAVFVEYDVVAVPDLADQIDVTQPGLDTGGMDGSDIDDARLIRGPGHGVGVAGKPTLRIIRGSWVWRVWWWQDAGGAGGASHRRRYRREPQGVVGGLDILDHHEFGW